MGNGNKAEMLIAICAVITSVVALFVAWDQGRVMRAQQHGSVYPVLQVDGYVSKTEDRAAIGLRVSNTGVGPALIENVSIWRGTEKLASLIPYRERLPAGKDISWTSMTGRSLAPNALVEPLSISWPRAAITDAELYSASSEWGELELEICYCSVFDRCWLARELGKTRAERVKRCERGETDIFEAFAANPGTPAVPAETDGADEAP